MNWRPPIPPAAWIAVLGSVAASACSEIIPTAPEVEPEATSTQVVRESTSSLVLRDEGELLG